MNSVQCHTSGIEINVLPLQRRSDRHHRRSAGSGRRRVGSGSDSRSDCLFISTNFVYSVNHLVQNVSTHVESSANSLKVTGSLYPWPSEAIKIEHRPSLLTLAGGG